MMNLWEIKLTQRLFKLKVVSIAFLSKMRLLQMVVVINNSCFVMRGKTKSTVNVNS